MQQPLTCSGVGGGFCVAALATASRRVGSASGSYERGARSKGKRHSTLASLCLLPSPYGLETATLVAASSKAANAERKAEQTVSSSACSCKHGEAKPLPPPKKKKN